MKVPGHRLRPQGSAGTCVCGWRDTAATRDDVRAHYRAHLDQVAPAALTLAELRQRATGMPDRRQASRADVITWLDEHRPQALDPTSYWR